MCQRLFLWSFLLIAAALVLLSSCVQPVPADDNTPLNVGADSNLSNHDLGHSRLFYLTPDNQDSLQLATMDMSTRQSKVMTDADQGLVDFTVAPDGSQIIYSAWNEDGGADLWSVSPEGAEPSLIVRCPAAACGRVVWSPDSKEVLYERHGGGQQANTPTLWRLDLQSFQSEPFDAGQQASASASWSPDGQWFSYLSPIAGQTTVLHAVDGRSFVVPNELAAPLVWDPNSTAFRLLQVQEVGDLKLANLIQYDLEDGRPIPVIDSERFADREAVWSPDGEWLALVRRDWTGLYPSKTQIWLMRHDGSEAHAVLAGDDYQYLSPVWSPDGNYLLFQRYGDAQAFVQPEVWKLELASGSTELVLPSAGQVVWAP